MKKTILFIAIALLLQGCALGKKQVSCQVKSSALNLINSSFSKGKRSYEIIEKKFEGTLYKKPILVTFVTKDKAKNDTAIDALSSTLSANKSCNVDWILDTFPTDEQEQIASLTANKEMMKKYKEYQDLIKEIDVFGEINYKDYIIYLVEFIHSKGPNRRVLPVYVKTAKGWKQTNKLTEDENYDLIYSAYTSGTISPK